MEWLWRVLFFLGGIGFLLFWIAIFKVGSDSDLRIEIATLKRELAFNEKWNQNISKDLDQCWRERENLEATLLAIRKATDAEIIETLKGFGVPDTSEESHD